MTDVLVDLRDGVAVLTLNRPDRMNAWTKGMEDALRAAFARAEADPAVRVLLLTGAGRAFCAGADMARRGSASCCRCSPTSVWRRAAPR